MNKEYELMVIYNIELGEQGAKGVSQEVRKLINTFTGEVKVDDYWGKRKFAYEINRKTEGYYDIVGFEMEPSKLSAFKKKMDLFDGVVRYLVTALS